MVLPQTKYKQNYNVFKILFLPAGKILNDDNPISEYKIDDKSFVVVMLTKVSTVNLKALDTFASCQRQVFWCISADA